MVNLTGPPLVGSRPRCRIRFLPPDRHYRCRQAPREPEGIRAQAVPHQPGPSRVPEEDCSQIKVWRYVAPYSASISINPLTHTYSRHRPQRPQVRLRGLAQVGSIDNSPCIFFPIDPAISLPSTITRGGCLFFNSDHKNAFLLMLPSEFDMTNSHVPSHPPTHHSSQQQETVYPRSRNLFNLTQIGLLGHSRQTSYQWPFRSCLRLLCVFSQSVSTL